MISVQGCWALNNIQGLGESNLGLMLLSHHSAHQAGRSLSAVQLPYSANPSPLPNPRTKTLSALQLRRA